MTEPETETEREPSAAIIDSQLAAATTTEEKGGEEEEEEEEEEEVEEEEVEAEAGDEAGGEEEGEEIEEEAQQEQENPEEEAVAEEEEEEEEDEDEQQPSFEKEEEQSAAASAKIVPLVAETKQQQQAENVSKREGAPISRKVAKEEGGKQEDEKARQDGNKKVEEKKIEVTKVEAKKVDPKKVEDRKIAVGKVAPPAPSGAEQKQVEMRDRLEDVEAEEEEEVEEEEEEEEEEVLEEKEEEEEEEEQEEEEEDQEQQLQLQQVQAKEEKMEEEEEEEEEEEDPGEEDELNERDGSPEEQLAFTRALKAFFKERRMDYKAPKFYGEELNVLKLWRAVTSLGGYDQVTAGKLWRKVGEQFQPPKTCTTLSWSFRGFYEKALLEYERYQSGVSYPAGSQPDGAISGADSQAAMSPNTPSSQPSSTPASGSGRARRDAATRAMHGWHAQRLGNGDVGDPIIKVLHSKLGSRQTQERNVASKKEKQLKNLVGSKRKETVSLVERAVKVARAKGSKGSRSLSLDEVPANKAVVPVPNKSSSLSKKGPKPERTKQVSKSNNMEPMRGLKLVITDDGPPADWVKINAYRTSEGYEIYALVPGLAREEVRIQCEEGGRVVICGSPEQPNNPWGVTAFRKVVNLPSKIDAHHTSAVVTLYGQLFVRVPFAHAFQ